MKPLIFILIFFLLSLNSFGQNIALPVLKNGKWGAVNTEFNLIVPEIYDFVEVSKSGKIIIKKDSLCGLLSSEGKKIIGILYSHINADNPKYFTAKKNNKLALYDYSGKQILDFGYYKEIKSEKYNYFILNKLGEKCLYIPEKKYKSDFCDSIEIKRKNLIFFYKKTTAFVLETDKNFKLTETKNPHYLISDKNNYIYRLGKNYRISNKKSLTLEFDSIKKIVIKRPTNAMASFLEKSGDKKFWYAYKNGKTGILNSEYKIIIPIQFSNIYHTNNKFYVEKEKLQGLYSETGKIIIPPVYFKFYKSNNNDFYIVKNKNKYGVLQNKKEVIPIQYDDIEQSILNNIFTVKKFGKYGVINIKNKKILNIEYDDIEIHRKCILFRKGKNRGISDLNGKIKIKVSGCKFFRLNNNFFGIVKNKKSGIININGKGIIQSEYGIIQNTKNNNIFYISSINKYIFEINDVKFEYYKWGLVNSFGEILLDTLYYKYQIKPNFVKNNIKISGTGNAMLIITFENNGRIKDKIKYENYISITNQDEGNIWKRRTERKINWGTRYWGLFKKNGKKIIPYSYSDYSQNFLGTENLVLTKSSSGSGIVDEKKGKIILSAIYPVINIDDFTKASVARCFDIYGKVTLINKAGKPVKKHLGFVDDFSENYTRANERGQIVFFKNDFTNLRYLLQVPGFNHQGLNSYFSKSAFCKDGKWGIMDTSGNFIVKPKYNFLQKFFRNEFIAKKNKKWGVITPAGVVKIDFIYDDIQHFFADTSKNNWADIPYYKVKIKSKWGVIDSVGNIVVDIKFDDVKYIYNNDIFFITKNYFRKNIFGYMDKDEIVKIKHNFYEAGDFKNGRASIKLKKQKYTFINKSGKLICDTNFCKVRNFSENLAAVRTKDGWGFIDLSGNFIINPKYSKVGNFKNGLIFIPIKTKQKIFGLIKSKNLYGFINKNEKIIIKPKFKQCNDFHNGFSVVKKNKHYGIIDTTGKYFIKPKFKMIIQNKKFNLFVLLNKKRQYALINSKGNFVIPFKKYKYIGEFSRGFYIVKNKSGYGCINEKGEEKIACTYLSVKNLNKKFSAENLSETKVSGTNKFVEKINNYSEGLASYEVNKLFGIYDKKGNCLSKNNLFIEPAADNIFRIKNINEIKYCK